MAGTSGKFKTQRSSFVFELVDIRSDPPIISGWVSTVEEGRVAGGGREEENFIVRRLA